MKRYDSGTLEGYKQGVGTIPAGVDHVTISHGLGSLPGNVTVTPAEGFETPLQVLQSSVSVTQFTVSFVGGVTLGVDSYFYWGVFK